LPTTLKERSLPIWQRAALQFERGKEWLLVRQQAAFFASGLIIVFLLLIFSGVTASVAAVAAWIALMRHFAQTDAERQRRITESYSKAVEQLASDKVELRLGGIYTLERVSRESPNDYRTVMETLTAFVRERARWKEPEVDAAVLIHEPSTDIAAVLAILVRRPAAGLDRERSEGWSLDLRGVDLRGGADLEAVHLAGAYLWGAHLEGAYLLEAHLEGAHLEGMHLEGANLTDAHFEGAQLKEAHLEGAMCGGAHLERAHLWGAHLEGANLVEAHFNGANLVDAHFDERTRLGDAHLEGANLVGTTVSQKQLESAFGDAATQLPAGVSRPASWSSAKR